MTSPPSARSASLGQRFVHPLVRSSGELVVVADVARAHVHVESPAVEHAAFYAERLATLARMAVSIGNDTEVWRLHDYVSRSCR